MANTKKSSKKTKFSTEDPSEYTLSYDGLWKLLIDKKVKQKELCEHAHVSPSLLSKMKRGENINIYPIINICVALRCQPGDIIEVIPKE
ncbi:MAG: helix-turn-helix transcriptional regulator [Oscillospiraceae bacterium]|nr:helix-turn-helix transcriptional regulator [Oscillospiraceae bacterium]